MSIFDEPVLNLHVEDPTPFFAALEDLYQVYLAVYPPRRFGGALTLSFEHRDLADNQAVAITARFRWMRGSMRIQNWSCRQLEVDGQRVPIPRKPVTET